ncbi:endoplasmic reticulum Ca-transporting P-type ATPase [Rhodotorula toruloides]|uniref:Endoplasmic reticulum Ca-transporting P-type ATPase n=1 Tax=Rhodotorula toruloides TaxID=5286 RepID=A0A511KHM5_RHOTO|nr:endoplasmic reticulum Ca-transporting P-type ATPase [Rhodotorula toruloides]
MSLEEAKEKENRQARTQPVPAGRSESRAELERARLERQRQWEAKRPKIATPPSVTAPTTKRRNIAILSDLPADDEPSTSSSGGQHPYSSRSSPSSSVPKVFQRFYKGAVRRVANQWYPDGDSFAFKELVGPPSTLRGAVVSAYCLDEEWIAESLPYHAFLLYVRPRHRGEATPDFAEYSWRPNTYRVIPKDKTQSPRGGIMHTKLLIFYHEDFCRIVISTANAVSYDWSQVDNAFYVHDFPRRRSASPVNEESNPFKNPTHTQFSKKFFQVCYYLDFPKHILQESLHYDFSSSTDVQLVHSNQGKFPVVDYDKGGGIAGLAKAVSALDFANGGHWEIEATGSSIGQYSSTWLTQMLAACSGIHPSTYFHSSKGNVVPSQLPKTLSGQPTRLPIKIIFPTQDEILGSLGGAGHGGTIFCQTKTWNSSTFPKHLFHRGESKRKKIPAHTKIILGLHKFTKSPTPPVHEGFIYLGSHNFTSSAWGRLQNGKDGPQLFCNNYELGVVLPIRASSAEELEAKATELVTYKRPPVKYGPNDEPWQQELFLK